MAKYKGTENKSYIAAMRELRRSNAAVPHRNKRVYSRTAKHRCIYGD